MIFSFSSQARFVALAGLAMLAASAQCATYSYATVNRPGATSTTLWDANNSGFVAGTSWNELDGVSSAFIYHGGTFTALAGPSGSISTSALGISENGSVVGSFFTSMEIDADGYPVYGPELSYIYSAGTYATFAVPGAINTTARAISPDGRYVSGYYASETTQQAFVLDTLTNAFAFTGGDGFTIAQGINNSYRTVGSDLSFITGERPGFIYDIPTGTRTDVMLPGTTRTAFRAIDNAGVISGWYAADGTIHGFTGYPGAFQVIDVSGANATWVEGSNDFGVLVGQYDRDGLTYAFIATPVLAPIPEPGTWALMLAGVALLGVVRRRG